MEAPPVRRRLHIFNPETEMALAAGGASYSAPHAIAELKRRWGLLPAVWAAPGDLILADNPETYPRISQLIKEKNLEIVGLKAIRDLDATPEPWGWNRALRNELVRNGLAEALMPEDEALRRWRELAHRKTAWQFHQQWKETFGETQVELPEVCSTIEDALRAAKRFGSACLKLPWSSSGRGVWFSALLDEAKMRSIARGAIKRQGALIVEKAESVALDFATEWESRRGECHFLGFSLFRTDRAGYSGNLSAPQEEIINEIEKWAPGSVISIVERQKEILNRITAPYYEGLFGVDMFATADGRINPCVEINLRRTMGHASLSWWKETGERGIFPAIVFT